MEALARSWDLPFEGGVAPGPLLSEGAARDARYAFLASTRARVGARWILTAHHADDQAETILHRILRGTGPAGLRGAHEWEIKDSLSLLTIKGTTSAERAIQFNIDRKTMESSADMDYLMARGIADMKGSFYE